MDFKFDLFNNWITGGDRPLRESASIPCHLRSEKFSCWDRRYRQINTD